MLGPKQSYPGYKNIKNREQYFKRQTPKKISPFDFSRSVDVWRDGMKVHKKQKQMMVGGGENKKPYLV
jgi:hypothetical protein